MNNNDVLTVYSASAGSGKTFTLAVRYIELLVKHPESYRSILAVTFTNKATDEMKLRILSQLYGLANSLPESQDYADTIKANFKKRGESISDKQIKDNARIALGYLLHNYSYFRIQTIDAFFQQVTRNMARELNLNANFKLSLNDKQVEGNVVDEMIEKLSPKSEVMKWILDYIDENISQDKNWNVINAIKEFGLTIFQDVYKEHAKALAEVFADSKFFKSFEALMYSIMKNAEEEFLKPFNRYTETLNRHGLCAADFKSGKSGACGYFEKFGKGLKALIADGEEKQYNKTAQAASSEISAWIKKSDFGKSIETAAYELMQLLNETEPKRKKIIWDYKSAANTVSHICKLRLLGTISDKVDEANALANRFPLSATQSLLNTMIGSSDAPFVYEKLGTQISHIMIDEFQDTSLTQWHNFKALLEDCLSRNSSCLVVGDIKQSIYRWRSSDWRLLSNIDSEFPNYKVTPAPLNTNFRSEANIIKFNNTFFETAASIEFAEIANDTNMVGNIYKKENIRQEISPKRKLVQSKGYVEVKLLPYDGYKELTMENVAAQIKQLLDNGAKENDIAILTRKNSDIAEIGQYLMEALPNITLVSDEAFVLEASLAVRTIITALRVMVNDKDLLSLATLARYSLLLNNDENPAKRILEASENIEALLPMEFGKEKRIELSQKPIYELAETIGKIFGISSLKNETAYIFRFFDSLALFLADTPAAIADVINEWDENMRTTPIQSDKVNGIRLLTIHKSKGLEFDNVLIPFCDWKLEKLGSTLWASPMVSPYSKLPIVPVNLYRKQLVNSVYEADYFEEHTQLLVDNMNLLYVAFTRAGKNLFVYSKNPLSKGHTIANTRAAIIAPTLFKLKDNIEIEGCHYTEDGESQTFTFGDIFIDEELNEAEKGNEAEKNVFKPNVKAIDIRECNAHGTQPNITFRQSNKSREFINREDEGTDEEHNAYIKTGTILHKVFSTIRTTDDIDKALALLEQEGELYSPTTPKEKLLTMLHKRLESEKVREWFAPGWQIFNECTLLDYDKATGKVTNRRPDRVMTNGKETIVVDFKFASPNIDHQRQVAQYVDLLGAMGYDNVKGYIWYVYTNKIVEVKK